MNLERTPLLLERRGRTRDSVHKGADRIRHRLRMQKLRSVVAREMDEPQAHPIMGIAMSRSRVVNFGPPGIMRHS